MRLTCRLAVLLLASALLTSVEPPAASAVLTERVCQNFISADSWRKLSICSRGWVDPGGGATRAVLEMHTYAYVAGTGYWTDSRSQSISVNGAYLMSGSSGGADWGTEHGSTCRVDGPAGRVACSVPNVTRVAFYSPVRRGVDRWSAMTYAVSWRDDRGLAHKYRSGDLTRPDRLPSYSNAWWT